MNVLLLLSGDAKDKWINAQKIIPKLASMQCGLPSLLTMEHLTKLPKDYETLNERPRNQQI
jgi:hypothetical protein